MSVPMDVTAMASRLREFIYFSPVEPADLDEANRTLAVLAALAKLGVQCPTCGKAADTGYSGGELGGRFRFSCANGHGWGAEWPT